MRSEEKRKEGKWQERKERREGGANEGRREERREGRKETESGISGHLLKVALQLYLLDLTYIRSQQACCALYMYIYIICIP